MKVSKLIIVMSALLFFSSFAGAQEHSHDHAQEVLSESATGSDLTLIQVMHDLTHQMGRIEFGIMTNNRYMIEQGAKAVVSHPAPEGGIKPYLRKNHEQVKAAVPEMDQRVHKTAQKMVELAKTADMETLQRMAGEMYSACAKCHALFRD